MRALTITAISGISAFTLPSVSIRPSKNSASSISFKTSNNPGYLQTIKRIDGQSYGISPGIRHGASLGNRGKFMQLEMMPEMIMPDFLSSLPHITLAASDASIQAIEASTLSALGHDILTFLLVTVLVIPFSRTVNVNPTLLFLLIGCLIGPYNLHLFSNNEADLQLGDFGILFLLFNEGLGLSPNRIKDLKAFSNLGIFQIMSSMAFFFFGTLIGGPFILQYLELLGFPIDDNLFRPILSSPVQAFCIASAGALSSSAFVLPVLKSKGWEDRKEGIAGLSILLLQDLAVAPLLVLLPVLAGSGPQTAAEFGTLIVKAVFGFGGVLVAGRYLLRYVFDIVSSAKSTETFVAAALLVAIGMGQTADALGLSASTGAFAAGVLLAGNKFRAQIQADIKPFEGILLGIFFITAGAELDLAVVVKEWPTIIVGIIAFLTTKALVLFASGPALGLTRAESARVAVTLSGGGEFSFVLFKLASDLGVLPGDLDKLLTASVIISMSLTPLLGEIGDYAGNYLERLEEDFVVNPWDQLTAEEAQAVFDECDTDKNESIDLEELRVALVKLNIPITTIAEIFEKFDSNGDNEISREEWEDGIDAGYLSEALRNSSGVENSYSTSFINDATVICGFGNMGRSVYGMLKEAGLDGEGDIVAFSLDPSRVTEGALSGAPVIFGDGGRYELFKAAGVTAPKAVLITYASRSRRLNVLTRIRATLPKETMIYARADDQREYQELIDAGADEVICQTTEAVVRFGGLLDFCDDPEKSNMVRSLLLDRDYSSEAIPGYSMRRISDLSEEVGMPSRDILKLYECFDALGYDNDGGDISISEARDFLMRSTAFEPLDPESLTRLIKRIDEDGQGDLTFEEFVRICAASEVTLS